MAFPRKFFDFMFVAMLMAAALFWLHGLSTPNLTLWDEAVNINVVKNLANHCCTPMLHSQDFGLDFRGWDNNYIWLHKPLLPFYLNAFLYRVFGQTVFSYRLLGLLSALITTIGIYLIGRKFFSPITGLAAAALFVINPYVFALVHELQFSGFIDVCFLAALAWSLYFLLCISQNPSRKNFLLFALFGSLAFLCKSGLAFGPYIVLVLLCLRLGFKKTFGHLLYAALLTSVLITPEMVLLAHLFPAQFAYEQSQYLQNFVADVEYGARPWDYYLSFYFSSVTGVLMAGMSWFAIGYASVKSKSDIKFLVLSAWIISYLFVLSFQVTKISNFLVPLLPPLCLLIPESAFDLLRRGKYRLISTAGSGIILFYLGLRYNILNIKILTFDEQSLGHRFLPIWAYFVLLAAAYVILLAVRSQKILKTAAYFMLSVAIIVVILSGTKAGWKMADAAAADSALQTAIQKSAPALRENLPKNTILLTQTGKMQDDHLYFIYWSGFDSIEVRQYQPVLLLNQLVPQNEHVYLISDVKQTDTKNVRLTYEFSVPFGYVYKLR